jgi:CheY-like chemotaxis protein
VRGRVAYTTTVPNPPTVSRTRLMRVRNRDHSSTGELRVTLEGPGAPRVAPRALPLNLRRPQAERTSPDEPRRLEDDLRAGDEGVTRPRSAARGRPSTLPPCESHPVPARGRPRVLLVDDNADALEMLASALGALGYQVETAPDGGAGLELARANPPEVAVLDIGLPVMDGFELARRMREDPRLAGIRLVALTGYGQASDRQKALEAGFDVHLVKPIDVEALVEALSSD